MVQAAGSANNDFVVHKQTMIVKNPKPIEQVYQRDPRVSFEFDY